MPFTPHAKSGMGFLYAEDERYSMPVNQSNDLSPLRSRRRAALLSVLAGFNIVATIQEAKCQAAATLNNIGWIIAMDSEDAYEEITEWLPWGKVSYLILLRSGK